ncbi:hypothetical protein AKJ37_07700 [candidate division MSBL1 archaeon SCGC-AAA259I09]|uniref:Uncharacterized protein n=2 Tax=candidate division MSBL1 TaxID=215777 RepID=A0A133UJE3_9EURY|nr:hypothetical protein AKJ37_07700 [candidate division MSBL1 archaeon SCGC-AAA259I09]KXA99649.1 hypothetical protein AKJ40_02670 [candidate division MSBL1 archaeon SCGC-AAA259M10]
MKTTEAVRIPQKGKFIVSFSLDEPEGRKENFSSIMSPLPLLAMIFRSEKKNIPLYPPIFVVKHCSPLKRCFVDCTNQKDQMDVRKENITVRLI